MYDRRVKILDCSLKRSIKLFGDPTFSVLLCTCGTFKKLGKQPQAPSFLWVSPVFHKFYVNNHIASSLQTFAYPGILTGVGTGLLPPPPIYSLKMISIL